MYLETERLIIRSLQLSDEKAFIEMTSDGSLDEDIFCGWNGDYHEWIKDWIQESISYDKNDDPQNDYLAYAIIEKISGLPVGSIGCSYSTDTSNIGIIYFIGTKYRGHGYATESAIAYVKYFREHYKYVLTADARTENIASCKVIQHAGFLLTETKWHTDSITGKKALYNFYKFQG